MASVLFRTCSGPIKSSLIPSSPTTLHHGSVFSYEKTEFSPLLHLEVNNNRRRICRAISEPKVITRLRSTTTGSQTFTEILPEMEEESWSNEEYISGGIGSLELKEKCFDRKSWFPAVEEPQFPDGSGRDRDGFGSGWPSGGSKNSNNERKKIGAYYQKMLKSNPNDPLLLRNYSKFLHEEGDTVKAEEYYGRAILANSGDGELLSLYGRLIWDTQRDAERSKSYFNQAVVAAPDDCMVMGSYALFMWETKEDEDDNEESVLFPTTQPLVAAF